MLIVSLKNPNKSQLQACWLKYAAYIQVNEIITIRFWVKCIESVWTWKTTALQTARWLHINMTSEITHGHLLSCSLFLLSSSGTRDVSVVVWNGEYEQRFSPAGRGGSEQTVRRFNGAPTQRRHNESIIRTSLTSDASETSTCFPLWL